MPVSPKPTAELSGFYLDPREAMPKAKRAAETALRLDEALAEAHAALGYVHLVDDWDGPAAAKALLRALDLNPTLATARLNYASYLAPRHGMTRPFVRFHERSTSIRSRYEPTRSARSSCCSRGATTKRSNSLERVWNSSRIPPSPWPFRVSRMRSKVGSKKLLTISKEPRGWTTV